MVQFANELKWKEKDHSRIMEDLQFNKMIDIAFDWNLIEKDLL